MKRWHLWSFFLRRLARAQGFLDPVALLASLQRFAKPSEVWAPTELLRSGAILQARGLINSQAIQHNRDWVWPYWAERQFDPLDDAFIPRAFNTTHINLTHRNWTAVGIPDFAEFPLVDPRGLVTPHFDGWSIDGWIVNENKTWLIPSRLQNVRQELLLDGALQVATFCGTGGMHLSSCADVIVEDGRPVCRVTFKGSAESKAWLVIAVRPYNPEGVSFIHQTGPLSGQNGWKINGKDELYFDAPPSCHVFSNYSAGDVFAQLPVSCENSEKAECDVGMATAAALYEMKPGSPREVSVRVPLAHSAPLGNWKESLSGSCRLQIPDKWFQFLYEAALRTLVLHSPGDVYPGPYTYKRFWFRDAAFILNAMLCTGLVGRAEKALDRFPSRQTPLGYFLSQDGEWDSNGEALWILQRFCRWTNESPKPGWVRAIRRGAGWIQRKRTVVEENSPHAGLLPAGFSAEHLGPNDFYYWDDFWGVAGLRAASRLMESLEEKKMADEFAGQARNLMECVERSLAGVKRRLGRDAMPASPTRRMDAGAIGSLAAGYPLQLWRSDDKRLTATAGFLAGKCFLNGGFYQEISHSGINAYLTLHVAQVLLRAGDIRFLDMARAIASMATSTGQWPEAIHPRTGGGCMGDGQHVWAAAEWALLMRHLFVREEEDEGLLVLCSGIPRDWIKKGEKMFFGPSLTAFGEISVTVSCAANIHVSWEARWHRDPPLVEVRLPGLPKTKVPPGQNWAEIKEGEAP